METEEKVMMPEGEYDVTQAQGESSFGDEYVPLDNDEYVPLDDIAFEPVINTVTSPKSVKTAAATSALLSGSLEEAVQYFNQVIGKDMNGEGAEALENLQGTVKGEAQKKNEELYADVMLSDMPDDKKVGAVEKISDLNSDLYDPNLLWAQKSLAADSDFDTEEAAEQRSTLADTLDLVNKQRYERHQIHNAAITKLDPDYSNAAVDFLATSFLPFVEPFIVGEVYAEFKRTLDEGNVDEFAYLAGNQKVEMIEAMRKMPHDKKAQFAEALANIISEHAGTPLTGQNDPAKMQLLEELITSGGYDGSDQLLDNAIELLDYTILGGVIARSLRGLGKMGRSTEVLMRDAARNAARGYADPQSAARIAQDTNPQLSRQLHSVVAEDETGEAAQALYGVNKDEALAQDLLPQVESVDGLVEYKVGDLDLLVSKRAIDQLDTGGIQYFDDERNFLIKKYTNMYENVNGMTARREMSQIGDNGDGVVANMTYGPAEGGFSSAESAINMAAFALRDLGIGEDAITLLQRKGNVYEPVKLSDAKAWETTKDLLDEQGIVNADINLYSKDYLVQVKGEMKFSDADADAFVGYSTKNNAIEYLGSASNSAPVVESISRIQNYALDPASMIDPRFVQSATRSVSRAAAIEKEILEYGGAFAKGFEKLGKKEKMVVESVIKEANYKGLKYTNTQAAADGLNGKQMEVLADWKRTWDTIYALENSDAVRTLRSRGYKELIDTTTDTKLFARPVPKGADKKPTVLDIETGNIRVLTNDEIDNLYKGNGTLAKLKDPQPVGDDLAEFVVVKNNPDNYLRELSDNTKALNYREGYYAVKYKDPWFIDRTFTRKDGSTYTKAVASAETKKDAEKLYKRMKERDGKWVVRQDGTKEFVHPYGEVRPDKKKDVDNQDNWDLNYSMGRSAQKVRGERLVSDADGAGIDPTQANIFGPVESMISSARSVANRVSMRKTIETGKARFLKQYEGFLPKHPITKKPVWPNQLSEIKAREGSSFKDVADARTTFNYINYLENGYINGVDAGIKAMFNSLANLAGGKSASLEKAFRWAGDMRGPNALGKQAAFQAYIVWNPVRQVLIQSHQAIQLTANFPLEVATKIPTQLYPLLTTMSGFHRIDDIPDAMIKSMGLDRKQFRHMVENFNDSGLVAQIDKQNLVKSSLTHIADQEAKALSKNPVVKGASDVSNLVRQAGFDMGETVNMATAYIAHYNKALRQGVDLNNKTNLDKLVSDTINYTYNMNAAGDMRYNQDSLSLLMQFIQVPHKAFTQMTFNRMLSPAEKAKLAGWNLAVYGLPSWMAVEWAGNMFPDNPDLQHAAVFGMESLILNKVFNDQVGTNTDFSGLAPTGTYGLWEHLNGMLTTNAKEIVAATPAGKLFVGNDPRISQAFSTAAKFFNFTKDNQTVPTTDTMVIKEFLKMSSGFSNTFKAIYSGEKQRTVNGSDLHITNEDMFRRAAFGFPTADSSLSRLTKTRYFEGNKEFKEDVKEYYSQMKKQLTRAGITPDEGLWVANTLNEVGHVWGNDPRTIDMVNRELASLMKWDLQQGEVGLVNAIHRMSGFMTPEEALNWAKLLPESDAYDKQEVIKTFENIIKEGE